MFRVTITSIFLIIFTSQVQAWVSVGSSPGFGTCNYTTIQAAIDFGDSEIRVLNNQTFTENIVISGSIDIKGGYTSCLQASLDNALGPNTEIDGSVSLGAATITIDSISEPNVRLYNLEITGGTDTIFGNNGHGIEIGDSNGIIEIHNSVIIGNTAEEGGGIYAVNGCEVVMYSGSSDPDTLPRGIVNNTASQNGGGVYLDLAAGLVLMGNINTGGTIGNNTQPVTLANNTATNNGGGVYAQNSFCDDSNYQPGTDFQNRPRGVDNPNVSDGLGLFDLGAFEYDDNDLIFADGFE